MKTVKHPIKFRGSFLLPSIVAIGIIFALFLSIVYWGMNNSAKKKAMEIAQLHSQKYAFAVKAFFDIDMGLAKGLANTLQYKGNYSEGLRDTIYTAMMAEVLKTSPDCISVWSSLELKHYQPGYTLDHGRKLIATMRGKEGHVSVNEYFRDMESPNRGSDYFKIKQDAIPVITEPYIDMDVGDFLITSIIYPIYQDGEFAGVSGLDIPLDSIQEIITQANILTGTNTFVFSNTGIIIGHQNPDLVGVNLEDSYPDFVNRYNILNKIENRESLSFNKEENGINYFNSVSPFLVNGTNSPWGVCVSIPETIMIKEAIAQKIKFLILGILGLIFVVGVLILFSISIKNPIEKSIKVIDELAHGNIGSDLKLNIDTGSNHAKMGKSVNLLIDNLKKTELFAEEIEKGNLEYKFATLGPNDKLGNALEKMRVGLVKRQEENEKRQQKNQQIAWSSEGLTGLAAILRSDASDLEKYTYNIISFVSQYINSMQGAIYLIENSNEKDVYIELAASYALSGNKLENKRIELEEGAIGACIKQKKTIHLKNIPENYVQVESSLGQASPTSIIIVPIFNNSEIQGAIELTFFEEIKDQQVTFIESACDGIGASISSIKLQNKTRALLEESRLQAEQMAVQEEIMRQNMEEMLATHKEMEKKEQKLQKLLQDLKLKEGEMNNK